MKIFKQAYHGENQHVVYMKLLKCITDFSCWLVWLQLLVGLTSAAGWSAHWGAATRHSTASAQWRPLQAWRRRTVAGTCYTRLQRCRSQTVVEGSVLRQCRQTHSGTCMSDTRIALLFQKTLVFILAFKANDYLCCLLLAYSNRGCLTKALWRKPCMKSYPFVNTQVMCSYTADPSCGQISVDCGKSRLRSNR